MNNPRVTPKDRNTIKGAIMRAFSRSELRREVLNKSIVSHSSDKRPRVKTWCICKLCGGMDAMSYMEVDHISPKVPVDTSLEDMTWDELVDNTWCDPANLQVLCEVCHKQKSKQEAEQRKLFRKERKHE